MSKIKPRSLTEVSREVAHLTDKLGLLVDVKIVPLVIGLRRWGIQTISSCQGHADRGDSYPWVDVSVSQAVFLATMIGWQNRPKFLDGSDNRNTWVLRPQFQDVFRLIPENKGRSLEELQNDAIEFGKFLQNLPDTWG